MHIFNQFSVKNYLIFKTGDPSFTPKLFWVNSGSTKLIEDIVSNISNEKIFINFVANMKDLLLGKSIYFELSEGLTYRKIGQKSVSLEELFTLYFHTGYLTIDQVNQERIFYKIPNKEILIAMHNHLNTILSLERIELDAVKNALFSNNLKSFQENIENILSSFNDRSIAKFFWKGGEGSYHLLFITFFLNRPGISVSSEIYSGSGYYDIAVVPNEKSALNKEGTFK